MSGPNKHYLPKFYQGYFFEERTLTGEFNYKKISYDNLYISRPISDSKYIKKEKSCENKKYNEEINNNIKDNFRYTGNYNEIFHNIIDEKISLSEKKERKILILLNQLSKKNNETNISKMDLDNIYLLIRKMFFRSKSVKNYIDYIILTILEDKIFPGSDIQRMSLSKILIEDESSKSYDDSFTFSKLYINIIIDRIYDDIKKSPFKYIQFINILDDNLILTENVVFTLNEKNNIEQIYITNFDKVKNILFLLKKDKVVLLTNNSPSIDYLCGEKINENLIKFSSEFILSEKIIDFDKNSKNSTIDVPRYFANFIYDIIKNIVILYLNEEKCGLNKNEIIKKINKKFYDEKIKLLNR